MTCSRAIPAPTRSRTATTRTAKDHAPAVPLESVRSEHDSDALRSLRRHGPPASDCQMDGFDHERAVRMPGQSAIRLRPARGARRRTSARRTSTCWPTACSRRTSTRVSSSHQYIIAAPGEHAVDFPSGDWGCEGGKSDTVATLTQDADLRSDESRLLRHSNDRRRARRARASRGASTRRIGRRAYFWSAYQAIRHIYRARTGANVISPAEPDLRPTSGRDARDRDLGYADCAGLPTTRRAAATTGPQWVASRRQRDRREPQFWDSTAIFVFWDDWGGWYDHVPPPYDDYDGLGFRVPLLSSRRTRRRTTSRTCSTSTAAS